MGAVILIGVFLLVAVLIFWVTTGKDRYAEMTDAEFEAAAKEKLSLIGAAMIGLEKAINPKKIEYVLKQKEKKETDGAGDVPPESSPPPTSSQL